MIVCVFAYLMRARVVRPCRAVQDVPAAGNTRVHRLLGLPHRHFHLRQRHNHAKQVHMLRLRCRGVHRPLPPPRFASQPHACSFVLASRRLCRECTECSPGFLSTEVGPKGRGACVCVQASASQLHAHTYTYTHSLSLSPMAATDERLCLPPCDAVPLWPNRDRW